MYSTINAECIVKTLDQLHARIKERLPDANLAHVCAELCQVASQTQDTCESFKSGHKAVRLCSVMLVILLLLMIGKLLLHVKYYPSFWRLENFLEALDAGLASFVLISGSIYFIINIEKKIRDKKVLKAINKLRALAHVIDMHQLTKDPESFVASKRDTKSSPKRNLSLFDLGRYLDYCAEMLAITSKIAALYAQSLPSETTLNAVDALDHLTNALSRKIWQKIDILYRFD